MAGGLGVAGGWLHIEKEEAEEENRRSSSPFPSEVLQHSVYKGTCMMYWIKKEEKKESSTLSVFELALLFASETAEEQLRKSKVFVQHFQSHFRLSLSTPSNIVVTTCSILFPTFRQCESSVYTSWEV